MHVISAAEIAQLGERQTEDLKVPGSIPGFGTETTGGLPIFYFIFLIYVFVSIFIIQPKIYVVLFSRFIEPTQELLIIGGTPFPPMYSLNKM